MIFQQPLQQEGMVDNSQLHNCHRSHQYPDCTDHLHKLERERVRERGERERVSE